MCIYVFRTKSIWHMTHLRFCLQVLTVINGRPTLKNCLQSKNACLSMHNVVRATSEINVLGYKLRSLTGQSANQELRTWGEALTLPMRDFYHQNRFFTRWFLGTWLSSCAWRPLILRLTKLLIATMALSGTSWRILIFLEDTCRS